MLLVDTAVAVALVRLVGTAVVPADAVVIVGCIVADLAVVVVVDEGVVTDVVAVVLVDTAFVVVAAVVAETTLVRLVGTAVVRADAVVVAAGRVTDPLADPASLVADPRLR